jgi:hypothetical protein
MTHMGEHYARAVAHYLRTEQGRTTDSATRRRLAAIDPGSVGFAQRHGGAAVHALRTALDALSDEGELTGLRPIAGCPELIDALESIVRA